MKKAAFTLIEIVVSLGILALGILAIFSLIPVGVQQTKKGHDQSKALILAQSKMEEIIALAAENWDAFNSYQHYKWYSPGAEPLYMGPNTTEEKGIWGWESTNPLETNPLLKTWVPKLGYQWEWHFITDASIPLPHPPLDPIPQQNRPSYPAGSPPGTLAGSLALITLTVSWPQDWSQANNFIDEQQNIKNINDYGSGGYVLKNSIQFVRLISYVSKGL